MLRWNFLNNTGHNSQRLSRALKLSMFRLDVWLAGTNQSPHIRNWNASQNSAQPPIIHQSTQSSSRLLLDTSGGVVSALSESICPRFETIEERKLRIIAAPRVGKKPQANSFTFLSAFRQNQAIKSRNRNDTSTSCSLEIFYSSSPERKPKTANKMIFKKRFTSTSRRERRKRNESGRNAQRNDRQSAWKKRGDFCKVV